VYIPEPELACPPPRRVAARPVALVSMANYRRLWAAGLSLLALAVSAEAVKKGVFMATRTTVQATVTGVDLNPKPGTGGIITYSFATHGERHDVSETLAGAAPAALRPGEPTGVAVSEVGSLLQYSLLAGDRSVARQFAEAGLGALLLASVAGLLVAQGFVVPMIERRICRIGVGTPGRVVRKRTVIGPRETLRYVEYEYTASGGTGPPLRGRATASQTLWEAVREGDALTVLYDPAKPRRSVAYALCPYRVVAEHSPMA
jgi:hypothetical protein